MPGFDAQFCQMLETEYLFTKKTVELLLVYPEQVADQIKSYCFRVSNILFKSVLDEIAFWQNQILILKRIIMDSKFFKSTKRICLDMMRCAKLYELVAGKQWFGNKTVAELQGDKVTFEKYICNGKLLEAAEQLLNSAVATVDALIISVRTAMDVWTSQRFEKLIAWYRGLLNIADIKSFLEKFDAFAQCTFGVCDIASSVVNYKSDIMNRMYLNENGNINRSRFKAILTSGISKIDSEINSLEQSAYELQASWTKWKKDKISHALS